MVTGGIDDTNSRMSGTRIFDLNKKEWSVGPNMQRQRYSHGCVRMIVGGKPIIWVTGGFDDSQRYSEYLEVNQLNQGWKSGYWYNKAHCLKIITVSFFRSEFAISTYFPSHGGF